MPTNTSVASYDTYTSEHWLNQNYGAWTDMQLSAGTGSRRYAYLYFAGMPPHGATVFSATLNIYLRDATTWTGGPTTITAKRVTGSWSESKLTWATSGGSQLATSTHSATAQVTNGTDGQQVSIDVTAMLQDVAAGSAWYGIRLEEDTGSGTIRKLYASESTVPDYRPTLTIDWSRPPDAPGDLTPGGGQSVSIAKPTLTWSFKDPDGDGQSEYQVQTCLDSTFGTVEFDTGWVVDSNTQVDLSTTAYAGLNNGDTKFWRVRVQDTNGLASPWSAAATFRRDIKGTFVLSSPADGGFVEETTPPITTTLTGRAQVAIAYTMSVQNSDGSWSVIWNSGRFNAAAADGTAFTFNVPKGIIAKNGQNYRMTAWSYDAIDRVATPGDPVSASAQATFTFNRSTVPAPVTSLTVTPNGPGVTIACERATQPDYLALRIDNVLVFDRLDPVTFQTGAPVEVNWLTGDSSTFEASVGSWVAFTNCTIAQSTAQAHSGTGSLAITATGAGNGVVQARNAAGYAQGLPCNAGDLIRVTGWFRSGNISRATRMGVHFYDASGNALGGGVQYLASTVNDSSTGWVESTGLVTAIAGSAYAIAAAQVQSMSAGGVHYLDDVAIDNLTASGQYSYALNYYGSSPNTSHTVEVEAVVDNGSGVLQHSESNATATLTPYVQAIWLVDDSAAPYATGVAVSMTRVDGQDSQDFTIGESSNVYYPIGRRDPVTITDSIRGLEGTITGVMVDDTNGYVDAFRFMKQPEQVGKTYRLIYGTTNIPVGLGAAHLTPQPYDDGGNPIFAVSIDVAQVGEFE